MKKYFLFFIVNIVCQYAYSQLELNSSYTWEQIGNRDGSEKVDKSFDATYIFKKKILEYRYLPMTYYEINHFKLYLNSQKAIDENNKFYFEQGITFDALNYQGKREYFNKLKILARVIKPNGEIIKVSKDSIFEGVFNGKTYKYFAVEGLEIGSILEIYTKNLVSENYLNMYTSTIDPLIIKLNDEYPVLDNTVSLKLETKLANKIKFETVLPEHYKSNYQLIHDSTFEIHLIKSQNIPPIKDELLSKKIDRYDFAYFVANIVTKNYQSHIYGSLVGYENRIRPISKKIYKKLNKMMPLLSNYYIASQDTSNLRLIGTLECLFKNEQLPDALKNDKFLSSLHNYSQRQQFHIVNYIVKKYRINHQVILGLNNYSYNVHDSIKLIGIYNEPLIYFPTKNVYFSTDPVYRLGPIDPIYFQSNNKIFYRNELLPHKAKETEAEFTIDSLEINVDWKNNSNLVTISQSLSGYFAKELQNSLFGNTFENQQTVIEEHILNYVNGGKILTIDKKNIGVDTLFKLPIHFNATVSTANLSFSLDSMIIINLGTLIGNQKQLQDDTTQVRIAPVNLEYAHIYSRKITIKIPEGYKIQNLNDLNINYTENPEFGIKTEIKLENNFLTIENKEWYNHFKFAPSCYKNIYKTFNLSYLFSKSKLILIKE